MSAAMFHAVPTLPGVSGNASSDVSELTFQSCLSTTHLLVLLFEGIVF